MSRPGAQYRIPPDARVERLEDLGLAISSSEIRRDLALHYTSPNIPAAVAAYIRDRHLYAKEYRP